MDSLTSSLFFCCCLYVIYLFFANLRTRIPRKPRTIYLGSIGASARAEMWAAKKVSEPTEMEISGHIDLDMRLAHLLILEFVVYLEVYISRNFKFT